MAISTQPIVESSDEEEDELNARIVRPAACRARCSVDAVFLLNEILAAVLIFSLYR